MSNFDKVSQLQKKQAAFVDADGTIVLELLNGTQYPQSSIKWVFDYYGPTGMPSTEGMLRNVEQTDIDELIEDGSLFSVKVLNETEIVLCHIDKP